MEVTSGSVRVQCKQEVVQQGTAEGGGSAVAEKGKKSAECNMEENTRKKEQLQMTNVVAVLEQDLTEMEQEISKLVSYKTKKKEDKVSLGVFLSLSLSLPLSLALSLSLSLFCLSLSVFLNRAHDSIESAAQGSPAPRPHKRIV